MTAKIKLNEGTRIYYNGDMANRDGFGTITAIETDRWGVHITIKMDDGREKVRVPNIAFFPIYKGHGGTRFVTVDAYNEWRHNQLKQLGITDFEPAI